MGLLLLGSLVSAWYLAAHPSVLRGIEAWVQMRIGGIDTSYSTDQFEIDLVDRINYARRIAKVPGVSLDNELESWLVSAQSKIDMNDLDGVLALILANQPRYFQVNVRSAADKDLRVLADRLQNAAPAEPNSQHLALLVREQAGSFGYEALMVIGQRLENFTPAGLNAHTSDTFFSICPHCKTPHACRITLAQRTINLDCPNCKLDYGVLAPDERGQFRWASDYLTGYEPPARYPDDSGRLHQMFTIWNAVIRNTSYVKDNTTASPNRDAWQPPLETMVRGRGDCEDSALLLADWLISRGFDARVALGRFGDMGQHAWVVVRVENVDYLLESTEGQPNPDKPPFVSDVGARYVPETLFDRQYTYVRARPKDRFNGSYWSTKDWLRVQPQKMFDDSSRLVAKVTGAASDMLKSAAPKPVATAASPSKRRSNDVDGIPMPPFTRLKDLAPGVEKWQLLGTAK